MDTYLSLKIKCAEAGTSITEVCREAGITPQVVLNWKGNEPKQFKTLRKLEATIQEIRDKRCS